MKFAVLIFGALGFAIVAVSGFSAGRQPDLILRDAAVGCLVTAMAGRWFWRTLDRAFAETVTARREAASLAAAAEAAATPSQSAKSTPPRPASAPKTAASR
jgi:hypothetical protein